MSKENSSHAPGSDSDFGGERQRHGMGEGRGPMKSSDFGIGSLPGTERIKGDTGIMGKELSDSERACAPAFRHSRGDMRATANSDHGPHHPKGR